MKKSAEFKHLKNDVCTWIGDVQCFRLTDGTLCTNPYMCSFVDEFKSQLISRDGYIPKPNELDLCELCRYNADVITQLEYCVIDLFNKTHMGCLYHNLARKWQGDSYGDIYNELCKAVAGLTDVSDDEYNAIKESVKLKVYKKNGGEDK